MLAHHSVIITAVALSILCIPLAAEAPKTALRTGPYRRSGFHQPLPAGRTPTQGRQRTLKLPDPPPEPKDLSSKRQNQNPDLPPGPSGDSLLDHRLQLRQLASPFAFGQNSGTREHALTRWAE